MSLWIEELPTGVRGGELKVGVGSRVDSAEAPVSPRSSAPRPLDFRRGRGMIPAKQKTSQYFKAVKWRFPGAVGESLACSSLSRADQIFLKDEVKGDETILCPKAAARWMESDIACQAYAEQ